VKEIIFSGHLKQHRTLQQRNNSSHIHFTPTRENWISDMFKGESPGVMK